MSRRPRLRGLQRGKVVFTCYTNAESIALGNEHARKGRVVVETYQLDNGVWKWAVRYVFKKGQVVATYPPTHRVKLRGFASQTPERRSEISAMGGRAGKKQKTGEVK